jgi:hypothetical protein
MKMPLTIRPLLPSLLALSGLAFGLSACGDQTAEDALTETEMGDVDTAEGTINDSLPNFDTLPNPANVVDPEKTEKSTDGAAAAPAATQPDSEDETPAAQSESEEAAE